MTEEQRPLANKETWLLGIDREMDVLSEVTIRIDHYALEARKAGATWVEIGRCLGISPQATHKRYGRD